MHQATDCLNCGTPVAAHSNFCSHCGQTKHVHRLNLAHLGHEVVHFFTHADKGIFYLIKALAIRPGIVAREYVEGHRKKYFSPLNFFFIVIGLFLFVQTTFRPMSAVNLAAVKKEVSKIPDATVRERRLSKLDRIEKAGNFTARYSNYINMAVTPLVSLMFFLFFYRSGYNYTEHLVANLYMAGFSALFYVFIITPYLVLTRGKSIYLAGIFAFLAWEVFYRSYTYYRFIPRRGKKHLLYTIAVSFVTVAIWYFISTSLIGWYIQTGFR